MYQDQMRNDLGKLLQVGMIQGKNPRVLAKELRQYWYGNDPKTKKGAVYCMERLMRTEMARVQTDAQMKSFERNDIDEYTFLANNSCCDHCQALHGKHFKVADMVIAENAPPLHPHCRCSTAAYLDRTKYNEWLDHLSNGGTMTLKEYKMNAKKSLLKNSKKSIIPINLQRFAESDIKKQESNSLKRAIRKYERRIAEHKNKISNPSQMVDDWNAKSKYVQDGLIKHWNKEIKNFQNSIDERIAELKKRGDYDE